MTINSELTAKFGSERQRWPAFVDGEPDTIVATVFAAERDSNSHKAITIKGQADKGEFIPDVDYRFFGHWSDYKNARTGETERQFHFNSFVESVPVGKDAIVTYLVIAGRSNKLGPARARKIWEAFGDDSVRVLREEPMRVVEVLRAARLHLVEHCAIAISDYLKSKFRTEGVQIELTSLLAGRGFPRTTTRNAIQKWGTRAGRIIKRDPYKLMALHGCGFKKCDQMYLDLQLPPDRLKRQALCGWYSIASDTEGHTWYPAAKALTAIRTDIAGAELDPDKALRLAIRGKALSEEFSQWVSGPLMRSQGDGAGSGAIRWLAGYSEAKHEREIAEIVAESVKETANWPDVSSLAGLSEHQREQLGKALRGSIAILGGSPGTGKTYSAAVLIKELGEHFGLSNVLVAAPTGKAAVRVTENLVAHGLDIKARTWHSWLNWLDRQNNLTTFPHHVLIGDETSMNDTDLMARIMRARSRGCHMLLIGDINQLPPVGHGAPLRDMIAAGVPYGELREIRRQDNSKPNAIIQSCADIRDGKPFDCGPELSCTNVGQADAQIRSMLDLCKEARAMGLDPIWDVQILTAVNDKSPLSRKALNAILQAELNQTAGVPGNPFRVGDKIVNTKNATFPLDDPNATEYADMDGAEKNDRGEVFVANGELAKVLAINEKHIICKLSAPDRVIRVPRGKAKAGSARDDGPISDGGSGGKDSPDAPAGTGSGCTFELGYAITCHKLQGSEQKLVGVMVDDYPGAKMVCSREWLYTAISRAKIHCRLIGLKSTAERMCRNVSLWKRKTFLKERILVNKAMMHLEHYHAFVTGKRAAELMSEFIDQRLLVAPSLQACPLVEKELTAS